MGKFIYTVYAVIVVLATTGANAPGARFGGTGTSGSTWGGGSSSSTGWSSGSHK